MSKREPCASCSGERTRHSKTILCPSCTAWVRREIVRRGESPMGGPRVPQIEEFWIAQGRPDLSTKALALRDPVAFVEKVAAENQVVVDWNARVLTLPYDRVVVASDQHIPRHDPEVFKRIAQVALAYEAECIVFGGDLLDFEDLSTYPQPGPSGPGAKESVIRANEILGALMEVCPNLVCIGGNHDALRTLKTMDRAVQGRNKAAWMIAELEGTEAIDYEGRYRAIMERWSREKLGELASRVRWCPETHLYIHPEGGERTKVTHQKSFSRNPSMEGKNIHYNEGCHVITTHTHGVGAMRTPNGKCWVMNVGCGTRREWHHYATRHETGMPEWQRALALVWRGVPELFSIDSDPRKWEEVERLCETRKKGAA